ncbi:MAG: hypothetical protein UFA98_10165 [Ruminococcus sp.]|nr:hypothetical protein [Ruminococcus sp.]
MKKGNLLGLIYFIVHFFVEVCSFYVVTSYTQSEYVWVLMLIYDFLAFVPQGFFGFLRDRGIKINFALWGTVLTSLSLVMMIFSLNAFLIVATVSVGNCLVHIHGAELTLRQSAGKMTPAAVFVAGGSFGLITGKLLCTSGVPAAVVLGINLLSFIPVIIGEKFNSGDGEENLAKYNFATTKLNAAAVIALAVFVVAVRSFMGYGIPTTWNKTVIQNIALYCFMGLGKALGGVLIDKIGIRKTSLISTIVALPFLLFGADLMAVSLIGIMFFSMTMAVTLALIVSRIQSRPGIAFGFTTIGLFLGFVPLFFVRIRSVFVNCVIITVLTVVCVIILTLICAKENTEKHPGGQQ